MAHTIKIQQQKVSTQKSLFFQNNRDWLVLKINKELFHNILRGAAIIGILAIMAAAYTYEGELSKDITQSLYIAGSVFCTALFLRIINNKFK